MRIVAGFRTPGRINSRSCQHQKDCAQAMPQIIVKGILFRQIRHLIIPDTVIAQIQKQIAGCKCYGKNTGCLKSADSGNDNEQKNRLPGVQNASDCIP